MSRIEAARYSAVMKPWLKRLLRSSFETSSAGIVSPVFQCLA
jgi:hypothetical protein